MRKFIRLIFIALTALVMIRAGSVVAADPEMNPLPVTSLCPPVETLRRAIPLRDGTLMLLSGSRLVRVNRDMGLVETFSSPDIAGVPTAVVETSDGKFIVLVAEPNGVDFRLVRLMADGQFDASFVSPAPAAVQGFALADDGKIYRTVDGIIRRIDITGAADPTFNSGLADTVVRAIVPGPNGTIYVRPVGNGRPGVLTRVSRLLESGAIDPTFTEFDSAGISRIGEFNYSLDARGFVRLAASGEVDPTFAPIFWSGAVSTIRADGASGLFRFVTVDAMLYEVDRFNLDGTPDTAYRRGTFQIPFAVLFVASADERDLYAGKGISTPGRDSVEARCGYLPNFVRVELKPAEARLVFEPGTDSFAENSAATFLTILRTGENTAPRAVSFRMREGSARAGVDYLGEAEGALDFAEGISRRQIPITFLENDTLNHDRSFFVDLIDSNGIITTLPATIRNNDVGLIAAGRVGDELELIGFGGAAPYFQISTSSDLTLWTGGNRAPSGQSLRVPMTETQSFFKARGAYSLTGR